MTLFLYKGFGQKSLMYYFASLLMKNAPQPYSFFNRVSAIMMIVALSWLTISAPFVFEQQEKMAKENSSSIVNFPIAGNEEEAANPFSGSTEEKAPKSLNTFSEEYLHDHHYSDYLFSIASKFHKCEDAGTYVAYHGELLVPPPNKA
jgi:hypothetical protein